APWNHLVAANALPDTMGIAPFLSHGGASPATEVAVGVAVALVLFLFAPRRIALVLPVLVLTVLVSSDVSASNLVAWKVRFDQAAMVGTPRNWIERATASPVAYVYAGDATDVNIVWQQRFWNPLIEHVVSIPPWKVTGPIPAREAGPRPDGQLPIRERYVVAN